MDLQQDQLYNEIKLAAYLKSLNQTDVTKLLQQQQESVYNDVISQKNSTLSKLYGDLEVATSAHESTLMHRIRNKELIDLNTDLLKTTENNKNNMINDRNLSSRKYEMNEWTVNNKKDTLFIFSMLFVVLSGLLLTTGLWKLHVISTSFWLLLSIPMILIFILTVIYRSQYTNIYRNKRYWNKKKFEGKHATLPIPTCDNISSALNQVQNEVQKEVESIKGPV